MEPGAFVENVASVPCLVSALAPHWNKVTTSEDLSDRDDGYSAAMIARGLRNLEHAGVRIARAQGREPLHVCERVLEVPAICIWEPEYGTDPSNSKSCGISGT